MYHYHDHVVVEQPQQHVLMKVNDKRMEASKFPDNNFTECDLPRLLASTTALARCAAALGVSSLVE